MHSEVCMIKHNMTFKEQIEEEKNKIEMLTERPGRLKKKQKTDNHRSRERRFFLTEDGEGNIK